MKTRTLIILAVAVLCTTHAHSQLVRKGAEVAVRAATKTGLEIAVPTLEKGIGGRIVDRNRLGTNFQHRKYICFRADPRGQRKSITHD